MFPLPSSSPDWERREQVALPVGRRRLRAPRGASGARGPGRSRGEALRARSRERDGETDGMGGTERDRTDEGSKPKKRWERSLEERKKVERWRGVMFRRVW